LKQILTAGALALALTVSPVSAFAAEKYKNADVIIDGKRIEFSQQGAIIKNGVTLIPMRQVFSELGATVSWDQATQGITAVKDTTKVKLTIGSKTAQVNGEKVILMQAPEIINGTTLVPLRFIGESLGSKVSWDSWRSAAVISSIRTNEFGVKYSLTEVQLKGYS